MDDFWQGMKYDYPQCCVDFFVNVWPDMDHYNWWNTYEGEEYILCPECIIKNMSYRIPR